MLLTVVNCEVMVEDIYIRRYTMFGRPQHLRQFKYPIEIEMNQTDETETRQ